jgi:hypothetical protein
VSSGFPAKSQQPCTPSSLPLKLDRWNWPNVRQVGRELGVRYVLEGSVRKAANRVRITGQLIEAEKGAHLWADRFEGALTDVFDMQDKTTESIVGVVEPSVRQSEIERSRRKRPESLVPNQTSSFARGYWLSETKLHLRTKYLYFN